MLRLALAALLLAPVQDEAALRSTIEKLEDDAFDVRDRAQKDLVRMGEAALPALRKAIAEARDSKDRGELLLRAEAAVREIELAAKSRSVCPEAPLFTFRVLGDLGDVGAHITKLTGLPVEYGTADRSRKLSFDVEGAPLMKVLDEVCRRNEGLTWEFKDDGKVLFKADGHVQKPSAYAGAFRTKLASMKLTRSTDFKGRTATLIATLEAEHDPTVKPSKDREIEITKATDDKGTELEAREGEDVEDGMQAFGRARFGRVWVRGQMGGAPPAVTGTTFTLKGIHPEAKRITLQGRAKYRFPLDRTEIRIERPQGGETRELGEFTMRLESFGGKRWTLAFRKTKGQTSAQSIEELGRRLDAESALAIDEDGIEHKGTLAPSGDTVAANIVIVNGQVQETVESLTWAFQFPTLKSKAIKELRFRFADKVFEKVVPFTLENVDLP
jgi:hypothetical protein